MEKKNQENNEQVNGMDTLKEGTIVEEKESKVRKIVKYALIGLATVATGVLGFVFGRNSVGDDKEESSETEEKTE